MTDRPIVLLSGKEVAALRFAAHRQLTRWAQRERLSPREHTRRAALVRSARILGDQAFADGCELRVPGDE